MWLKMVFCTSTIDIRKIPTFQGLFAYFECVLQMFVSPFSWYSFQGYLLNVHSWKKNSLLYIPKLVWKCTYLPSHSENCHTLFTDSQDPTPPQMLFYHNKLQGAGGTLFSTKCFSDLTTTLSLQMTGNPSINQEVTWT